MKFKKKTPSQLRDESDRQQAVDVVVKHIHAMLKEAHDRNLNLVYCEYFAFCITGGYLLKRDASLFENTVNEIVEVTYTDKEKEN